MNDGTAGSAVHDNREHEPAPSAEAPRGWTWNRATRSWKPKVRGPVLWPGDGHIGVVNEAVHDAVRDDGTSAGSAYEPDPEPGWMSEPGQPDDAFKVTAEVRADVKALIALCYTIPAESLPLMDPYCFGPLGERKTANAIIDSISDIVCASPRIWG